MQNSSLNHFYSGLFFSLSPLHHQVIMESSDSLSAQAISLPPTISEHPNHMPPALPPKRHRTTTRLNSLNTSPPSSPKCITTEPLESPSSESSHPIYNTSSHLSYNNNSSKFPTNEIMVPRAHLKPISPSSNYVQITTCTMNAAAAAAASNNSVNDFSPSLTIDSSMCSVNGQSNGDATIGPETSGTRCTAPNENDVRVIYTNVNQLDRSNNRLTNDTKSCNDLVLEHHADAKKSDRLSTNSDKDVCYDPDNTQCITNNNNTLKNANAVERNDDDVVVLRRLPTTPKDSLKVYTLVFIDFSVFFDTFFWCKLPFLAVIDVFSMIILRKFQEVNLKRSTLLTTFSEFSYNFTE